MKYLLSLCVLLLVNVFTINAQSAKELVKWNIKISKTDVESEYQITANAKLEPEWHVFGQNPGDDFLIPTHFEFEGKKVELLKVDEVGALKTEDIKDVGTVHYYEKEVSFVARIRSMENIIKGFIEFQICNASMCLPPTEENFNFTVN